MRPKGNLLLLLAQIDGKSAAGSLSFIYKDKIFHEFMGYDYSMMKYNAGHALLWEEIQRAHNNGIRIFDWGLSPPQNKGLIEFKRRWGFEERKLGYFYYPDVKGYKKFIGQSGNQEYERQNILQQCLGEIKRNAAGKLYKHLG